MSMVRIHEDGELDLLSKRFGSILGDLFRRIRIEVLPGVELRELEL